MDAPDICGHPYVPAYKNSAHQLFLANHFVFLELVHQRLCVSLT